MFVTFICNSLICRTNLILLSSKTGCLLGTMEDVSMITESLTDIESLRCKMMNADHDGLRYAGTEDALIFVNEATRIVRSIRLHNGQASIATSFEDSDRNSVQPISLSAASSLIDAWQRSAARLAAH